MDPTHCKSVTRHEHYRSSQHSESCLVLLSRAVLHVVRRPPRGDEHHRPPQF